MKEELSIHAIPAAAIILTAGNSERFGRPKSFLAFDSNTSFIEKLLHEYIQARVEPIVIVAAEALSEEIERLSVPLRSKVEIRMVVNKHPEAGRFASIRLGANAVEKYKAAFVQNVDNPFTTSGLLQKMKLRLEPGKYAVPVFNGRKGHPVLLSLEILEQIRVADETNMNLRDLLETNEGIELITREPKIHANINTEQEYLEYFAA